MEEEKLILPQERKPQSRPKSSPSTRDASPAVARRPATAVASRVSDGSDLQSVKIRGQNNSDTSLQTRDEMSQKQADKEKMHESGEKPEAVVHGDGVGTSKVEEAWTEPTIAGGDDNTGMADYSISFIHVNEQIPYESPPKYCERQFHGPFLSLYAYTYFPLAVDYSSVRHLLELTEGETDLDSDKEIPDIFSKVSYSHAYSDHLKNINVPCI